MIVGMYVGLEAPCWVGAAMALLNCVEDKVEYAKRFGVNIDPEEWPVSEFPARILGDRGEMEKGIADVLAIDLGTDIENTVAYFPIAKGGVECGFKILHAKIRSGLPGYVDPEYDPRKGKDYVLDAMLDIKELTGLVILASLNANHDIKRGYKSNVDIVADKVPYRPIDLWHWGKEKYRCEGRVLDPQYVMKCLLPRKEVTVDEKGIKFKNNVYYISDSIMAAPWYFKAKNNRKKLTASHHPGDMNYIYVRDPDDNKKWHKCGLSAHSGYCENMTYTEVEALRNDESNIEYHGRQESLGSSIGYVMDMRDLKEKAISATMEQYDPNMSKRERTEDMTSERRKELDRTQKDRALHLNGAEPEAVSKTTNAQVQDADHDAATSRFSSFRKAKNSN
jgi:hypothetical protein